MPGSNGVSKKLDEFGDRLTAALETTKPRFAHQTAARELAKRQPPESPEQFTRRLEAATEKARADAAAARSDHERTPDTDEFRERMAAAMNKVHAANQPGADSETAHGADEEPLAANADDFETDEANEEAEPAGTGPVGSGDYEVKAGDCLDSIAVDHGFFWETIWNHHSNNELRTARDDPFVLLPGDHVHIPERTRKEEPGQTEQQHRFRRKGFPAQFVLTLRQCGEPRANQRYLLIVDGDQREGKTDAQGRVKERIPPNARRGRLLLGEEQEEYLLQFGHVDPITEVSGVQHRLQNLDFYDGEIGHEMDEETAAAIAEFQRSVGLRANGKLTKATRDALREAHGS